MVLYSVFTRHLTCYTWCMIYGTGTWYIIFDTWSTTLDMLYLIPDPQHLILTPVLDICHTCYLILTPGIWHMLTLTWLAFMWYKHIDLTSWPLIGHYHPWYLYYMAYSWLSPLRKLDMIIILLPDIWYSWTPVYLNPWNREAPDITPDIILLLTPVIG